MSLESMQLLIEKIQSTGNKNAWVCERGNSFGYHDLIVDATAVFKLKKHQVPVIMDCTHPFKSQSNVWSNWGDPSLIEAISLNAVATGADGLFIETHPNPSKAKSDPYDASVRQIFSLY